MLERRTHIAKTDHPIRQTSGPKSPVVYGIIDPRDETIFFVGRATELGERRLFHDGGAHPDTAAWVQQIKAAGLHPRYVVLESLGGHNAADAEASQQFWIETLTARGGRLLNKRQVPPQNSASSRPANLGRAWTSEQDALMRDMIDRGKGFAEIAAVLGRTPGGIRARLPRLYHIPPIDIHPPSDWLVVKLDLQTFEPGSSWKVGERRSALSRGQWLMLKQELSPGDEVWEYSSPADTWSALAGSAGIAVVRAGAVLRAYELIMN